MASTVHTPSAYTNPTFQQTPTSATYSHAGSEFPVQNPEDDGRDHWSGDGSDPELDENGSKKRKRPMSVSCELCKQRKVKCDRGQPTCGWCAKNGQLCEYKERKKPGLRAGYGRELEARLDRLENILQAQQVTLAQLTSTQPSMSSAPAASMTQQQDANVFSHPLGMPAQVNPQGASALQQGSGQYTSQQQSPITGVGALNGYHQEASQQPAAQRQDQPMAQQSTQGLYGNTGAQLNPSQVVSTDGQPGSLAQDHDLPPYDLLYSLVDVYFKHVNTWCPILHRRTTLDSLFGTASLGEADRALLHAIVATTIRFSTDHRLDAESKGRYHASSKQKVLLFGLDNSSVKALQAQVILALDLCGESNGPPARNLLALITRSAVQLGLSVEATSRLVSPQIPSIYTLRATVLPEPSSWIEDESRRRLFWMIYILDRYAMITTAFDFALDEKEIDRKLPCRDDLFSRNAPVETRWFSSDEKPDRGVDRPENLGSFSFYVEIIGILSRIHQFLKNPIDITAADEVEKWQREYKKLDAALSAWKDGLPKEYANMSRLSDTSGGSNNKIVNCGFVMLHATYHTTTMRLHSSAAYPANRSQYFAPSTAASKRCLAAVEQISSLCTHVKNTGLLNKLGPPFAFSIWVAARLLLVHSTFDHQMDPTIFFFVTVLRELGIFWPVADRYAAVLQRVLDEFTASEQSCATNAEGEKVTPSSVRILSDMRRCAYDLEFLISRAPREPGTNMIGGPTPSRTPGPNELEYLDVFADFNMPRLPMQTEGSGTGINGGQLLNVPYGSNMGDAGANTFMYDTRWLQ